MNATLGPLFVALGLSASVVGVVVVAYGLATRNPALVVRSRVAVGFLAVAAGGQGGPLAWDRVLHTAPWPHSRPRWGLA